MPPDPPENRPDRQAPPFDCRWHVEGMNGATVRVSGELDLATADRLEETLRAASLEASLVVLDLSAVTFMDMAGRHAIVLASQRASREQCRLVVLHAPPHVQRLFEMTQTSAHLQSLDLVATRSDVRPRWSLPPQWSQRSPVAERSIQPLRNAANRTVLAARVMAVPDRRLWLHGAQGEVLRAWKPSGAESLTPAGAVIEVYLDVEGEVNGWRSPATGLAVNQRRLDQAAASSTAGVMICQEDCRLRWVAPAAEQLAEHDERCLTCGGTLAFA